MDDNERKLELAIFLLSSLERLSADCRWAHQASGLRGSLLRILDQVEAHPGESSYQREATQDLEQLVDKGFEILEKSAREIRTLDDLGGKQ